MIGFTPTPAAGSAKRPFSFNAIASWFQRGRADAARGELYAKSAYGVWAETLNPLRGLTASRAQDIFDRARRGVYAELAWLYQEIEAADPTLFVCTERREAATSAADWRIVSLLPERTPGWEDALATEQRDYLERAYGAAGDEIGAVAEHLSRGFFRGFAHARPLYGRDGVSGFELYDQWNFARDPATGDWWWNPDASTIANERFVPVPADELVTLERSRHIDYPALAIFIRAALGEKKWGIFLERYGIPPVTIIMPEFAEKSDEAAYMAAAEKLAKAGTGALPYGATVSYATEARGVNPFESFLRHQQEHVVMLATGGLLTTLTAPDSGTLAGNAHETTWRSVVARDIRVVARALNRTVTRHLLAERFPGRPCLAMIEFDPDPSPSATEVFDDAAKARAAGYLVDQADLEDRTGFKLLPENAPAVPSAAVSVVPNKRSVSAKPATSDAASIESAAVDALAEARAKKLAPLIDRILDALGETDDAAMRAALAGILDDLPKLAEAAAATPEDVALVERILSDAVGAGYAQGAAKGAQP